MNGKKSRVLRRKAEHQTKELSKRATRAHYQLLKRDYDPKDYIGVHRFL